MDFGYPQNLSPEILKLYITQEGVRSPFSSKVKPSLVLATKSMFPGTKSRFCFFFTSCIFVFKPLFFFITAEGQACSKCNVASYGCCWLEKRGPFLQKEWGKCLCLCLCVYSLLDSVGLCWYNAFSPLQVFLDIVESVNLLMSSKGR